MAAVMASRVADKIVSHAWNKDYTQVAICANKNIVYIYKATPNSPANTWKLLHELREHDQHVSSVDWSPVHNQIVTCSHDRNAYVWKEVNGSWQPNLVILRLNRAALTARWSPLGNKFAITSGAKSVCVCYYEAENNWWVSKLIKKKHESTVTAVAWHPSNVLVATASTDSKCRVFTAQVKGVDDDRSCAAWLSEDARFGDCLFEVSAESWIHAAVWSPSGTSLAFAAHNRSIGFVDGLHGPASGWAGNLRPTRYVELPEGKLPMRDIAFLSDELVVAGGYDCRPTLIESRDGRGWGFKTELCGGETRKISAVSEEAKSQFNSGFAAFRAQLDLGLEASESAAERSGETVDAHSNCIQCIRVCSSSTEGKFTFTTSGLDGVLAAWKV